MIKEMVIGDHYYKVVPFKKLGFDQFGILDVTSREIVYSSWSQEVAVTKLNQYI